MAIDGDILQMNKKQCETKIRALKAEGKKVNVSGNVAELRQRIQDLRDGEDHASSAAIPLSGALNSDIHPSTISMVKKLLGGDAAFKYTELEDEEQIELLNSHLQPVLKLIDDLIDVTETMSLGSSVATNFATLSRLLRNRLPKSPVTAAVRPLFQFFDLTMDTVPADQIATATQSEHDQIEAAKQAEMDSLQAEMRRRYEEEQREAEFHSSQPERDVEAMDITENQGALAGLREGLLELQINTVQQSLREKLLDWSLTFPPPENRTFPLDFSSDETTKINGYTRKWARNLANKVNHDLPQQPDTTINACVTTALADDDFPVEDAKREEIIKQSLKKVCLTIHTAQLKVNRVAQQKSQAEAEAGGTAGTSTTRVQMPDAGPAGGPGKGKKRAREEDVEMTGPNMPQYDGPDSQPDFIGYDGSNSQPGPGNNDDNLTPAHGRHAKSFKAEGDEATGQAEFLDDRAECMFCYFNGVTCDLNDNDESDKLCGACVSEGVPCRVLCDECKFIAGEHGGRGSGQDGADYLLHVCELCDVRQVY
ncbi:hypothetical protein LTR86_002719 [Recurvomyces mirabilis]|nr:hypothetical protein LTR86_002719 [Recurvomyces mirabilis]